MNCRNETDLLWLGCWFCSLDRELFFSALNFATLRNRHHKMTMAEIKGQITEGETEMDVLETLGAEDQREKNRRFTGEPMASSGLCTRTAKLIASSRTVWKRTLIKIKP